MIGAIVGAVGGIAGSLIGGHNARKEKRRQRAIYKNQLAEARANAIRYANQDFSQSAAAQDAVRQTQKLQEQSMQEARGADAVTGGRSAESAVAANAQAQAQLASSLAQQGEAQRQSARQYYGGQVQAAQNALAGMHGQAAAENTAAANQAMNAGMGLAAADLQSHLSTGKGLLGDGGKNGTESAGATEQIIPDAGVMPASYSGQVTGSIKPESTVYNMFGFS